MRSTAASVGDAMRDLDNRDLITGDFLLVSGDVVSNLSIEPALTAHRARRAKDRNAIMTMVLREAGASHRTKPKSSRPVFFIDPEKDRCVHYEEIGRKRGGKHHMELDIQIMKEHPEIDIRGDLLDCYIDICTPDVLGLWSDNFDYQSMRTSFLFGVLKDYELNGKTIHTHIESKGYAARVRSLRAYDAVTRDIIDRWTYPLTPDCNFVSGQSYTLGKHKTYVESGVVLARGSHIQKRSIVGSRTSIGDKSTIASSTLGRRCQIGKNVTIRDSYIWDDVVIGDNTTITKAIIASESSISHSCTLKPGAIVSFGVDVPASCTISASSEPLIRTTSHTSSTPRAPSSDGYDSNSDSSTPSAHLLSLSPAPSFVSNDSISTIHSDDDLGADDLSLGSSMSADLLDSDPVPTSQQKDFLAEAAASIYDGLMTNEPEEKIRLELVAQRLASDAADSAVRDALVEGFMRRVWSLVDGDDGAGAAKVSPGNAVKDVWSVDAYGGLIKQMGIFDREEKEKVHQVSVLKIVEGSCIGRAKGKEVLLFVAKEGFDGSLFQKEGILEWLDTDAEGGEEVRSLAEGLVEYLDAEEESSEEETEEETEEE